MNSILMWRTAIRAFWAYRGFILGSVSREFQSRFLGANLGALWTIINPLAMILIYTVIFSRIMHTRLPGGAGEFSYSVYLCAGVLTWGLFSEIVSRSTNIFIEYASLMKKVNFPRLCLPVIVLTSATLNFLIVFAIFLLFLVFFHRWPGLSILAFLPVLTIQLAFSIGLGMTLGVINVFVRDVSLLFGVILQFWFWLTPIVYLPEIIPEWIRPLVVDWNPLSPLMAAYQSIFVQGIAPSAATLLYPAACALIFCYTGTRLYLMHAGDMVDEL